jgi:NADPH:quinone reductase|tara:strand:- start:374 stop:646 length:273 start_codon:yes stop_codon:yes gene_type:complete
MQNSVNFKKRVMLAMVCKDTSDPDGQELEDMPKPEMVLGGVRITVRPAGLNFAVALTIKGKYQVKLPFPFGPGLEISGDVLEVVTDVKKF